MIDFGLKLLNFQIRKEISEAADYQISCIHARKTELLLKLEGSINQKEQNFLQQEKKFKQAIGMF